MYQFLRVFCFPVLNFDKIVCIVILCTSSWNEAKLQHNQALKEHTIYTLQISKTKCNVPCAMDLSFKCLPISPVYQLTIQFLFILDARMVLWPIIRPMSNFCLRWLWRKCQQIFIYWTMWKTMWSISWTRFVVIFSLTRFKTKWKLPLLMRHSQYTVPLQLYYLPPNLAHNPQHLIVQRQNMNFAWYLKKVVWP